MTELERILGDHDGRRDLEAYFGGLIRDGDFATLEAELREQIAANSSPFAPICLAARREQVAITGWDGLHADIAETDAKGKTVTAVGVDLTGHWEGEEPGFEVSLYDDSAFAFSTASDGDLLAASTGWSTPWQGCFLECGNALACEGLADLHQAITGYADRYTSPGATLPQDYAGFVLAGWWLQLRIHQGFADALASGEGLPRAMPIVVGQHDFGFDVVAFYRAPAVDRMRRVHAILEARTARHRDHFDRMTEQFVVELREKRQVLRDWPWWRGRKHRRKAYEMVEAHERMLLDKIEKGPYRTTADMPDTAFEMLLNRFRDQRRPGSGAETRRADPGEARSELHRMFLTYAARFGRVAPAEAERRRAA